MRLTFGWVSGVLLMAYGLAGSASAIPRLLAGEPLSRYGWWRLVLWMLHFWVGGVLVLAATVAYLRWSRPGDSRRRPRRRVAREDVSDGLLLTILEDLGDVDAAQVSPGQESDDSIGGENDDDDENEGPGRRGEREGCRQTRDHVLPGRPHDGDG